MLILKTDAHQAVNVNIPFARIAELRFEASLRKSTSKYRRSENGPVKASGERGMYVRSHIAILG